VIVEVVVKEVASSSVLTLGSLAARGGPRFPLFVLLLIGSCCDVL